MRVFVVLQNEEIQAVFLSEENAQEWVKERNKHSRGTSEPYFVRALEPYDLKNTWDIV